MYCKINYFIGKILNYLLCISSQNQSCQPVTLKNRLFIFLDEKTYFAALYVFCYFPYKMLLQLCL